jgi:hypothetical protein
MLLVKKGQENRLVVTASQNKDASSSVFYLFSIQHIVSGEKVRFYGNTILSNNRYDEFSITEITDTTYTEDPLNGYISIKYPGQYYYGIYQMNTKTLDPSTAVKKLEEGRLFVYDTDEKEYFIPYISSNEKNDNYVYLD